MSAGLELTQTNVRSYRYIDVGSKLLHSVKPPAYVLLVIDMPPDCEHKGQRTGKANWDPGLYYQARTTIYGTPAG